jgi:phosphomevalonate kinase
LSLLLPYSKGVYGSDLGLEDKDLARQAFGLNTRHLAKLKQECDPLNILGCACPISADEDPRVQGRGVVIIFSGRRCSGKDWLASVVHSTLGRMIGGLTKLASISNDVKMEFTKENPLVDYSKLSSNRSYKDSHRKALTDFYHRKRDQDLAYDAKCFVKAVQSCDDGSILLLTGVRNGLEHVRRLAGKPVVLIKIESCEKARQARGWTYDCDIDKSQGELSADGHDDSFWDLVYVNNFESNTLAAEEWTKDILVPCIFKRCTRSLQDTPRVGIQYRYIFGSLLLQPFSMSLWAASVLGWIEKNGQGSSIDAIVAPEAAGFAFGSPIAAFLKKPLILMRKARKLKGAVDRVMYDGSNLHEMMNQGNAQGQADGIAYENNKCCSEVLCGAIVPGQRILVVDDCLVLDLALRQGGLVTKLAVLLELPDLSGRPDKQIEIFSLMKFHGK